jgi:queuosine precursor transporter
MESQSRKHYRLLSLITSLNITFQLVSDVTAGKLISVFGYPVSITVLYFPVTYIISDILTEVYGYAKARKVLWTTLLCSVLAGIIYQVVAIWTPASIFSQNEAYVKVLQSVPRILLGGWLAVFSGDIANNFTLAKLKVMTEGKLLWLRTISSTVVGQLVNTAVFYIVALSGILPNSVLVQAIVIGWIIKTLVEIIFTPLTYVVVAWLKRVENEDFYDRDTNFNPFNL